MNALTIRYTITNNKNDNKPPNTSTTITIGATTKQINKMIVIAIDIIDCFFLNIDLDFYNSLFIAAINSNRFCLSGVNSYILDSEESEPQ